MPGGDKTGPTSTSISRRHLIALTTWTLTVGGFVCGSSTVDAQPAEKAEEQSAGSWGNLTGRFVFDGPAPPRKKIVIPRSNEYCGESNLLDESLIVDPKNRGLANIVVSLYRKRGAAVPAVHPQYEETATAQIELKNYKCRFEPHMVLLRNTQSMLVIAGDPFATNTKIETLFNPPINAVIPSGTKKELKFPKAERYPCRLTCPVHRWEGAWVVVKDHPYVAASDAGGKFAIKNLPVGTHTFQIWHERAKCVKRGVINGKKVEWSKGRVTVEVKPGTNDLGEIKLSPELFR